MSDKKDAYLYFLDVAAKDYYDTHDVTAYVTALEAENAELRNVIENHIEMQRVMHKHIKERGEQNDQLQHELAVLKAKIAGAEKLWVLPFDNGTCWASNEKQNPWSDTNEGHRAFRVHALPIEAEGEKV